MQLWIEKQGNGRKTPENYNRRKTHSIKSRLKPYPYITSGVSGIHTQVAVMEGKEINTMPNLNSSDIKQSTFLFSQKIHLIKYWVDRNHCNTKLFSSKLLICFQTTINSNRPIILFSITEDFKWLYSDAFFSLNEEVWPCG